MAEQLHPYTGEPLSVSPLTWSHATYVRAVREYIDRSGRMKSFRTSATSAAPSIFLTGGALDRGALIRLEAVDARGEERLQRRRDGHLAAVLRPHRHELFDEEWVALRSPDHRVCFLAEQALDELA